MQINDPEASKDGNLGKEIILLIAAAAGKGIDASMWLAPPEDGVMSFHDFCNKLTSLSLAVGFQEDWETKREIELAVSPSSFICIKLLCIVGYNDQKEPLIDVKRFLNLCEDGIDKLLQPESGELSI